MIQQADKPKALEQPEDANRAIYKHAFWLYGVLVGVAIKEALESISHLVNPARLEDELTHLGAVVQYAHHDFGLIPEVFRLTVFLVLTVRFYLGSAFYFGAVYEAPGAREKFPITNYPADFFSGFLHFVCFVILALLIDVHATPIYYFPFMVGLILVWDLAWFASSMRRSTARMITLWMGVNLVTALVAAVTYLIIELVNYSMVERRTYTNLRAERCAFYWVLAVSVLDIGLMMAKRPFFQPLGKWLPRDDVLDPPIVAPNPAEPIPE
ncbi:MAG TPA: hypothetical protein VNG71_11230 [Pyrinomonadaceae bacterium]|nr:hypothetical protein [Pyrinomonadaceae bacterium]